MVIMDFFLRGGPTLSLMLATDFCLLKNCCFSSFTGDFGSCLEGEAAGGSYFEARSFDTYCSRDLRSSFGVMSCACYLVSSLLAYFFSSFFFYDSA